MKFESKDGDIFINGQKASNDIRDAFINEIFRKLELQKAHEEKNKVIFEWQKTEMMKLCNNKLPDGQIKDQIIKAIDFYYKYV